MGTPGNAAAAQWIADRMKELALAPGAPDGGYLQPFQAPVGAKLHGENALTVAGRALVPGEEFLPFTFSDTGAAEGELVWAGHGISAPDLGHDDYAGLDVKGKVVLVAAHFPRESDPASPFRDPQRFQLGEWRYKAMNARDHGAAGLLAVRDDWNHPGPDVLEPWQGQISSPAGIVAARATLAALRQAGVDAAALAGTTQAEGQTRSKRLGVRARLAAGVVRETAPTANVVGLRAGTDPAAGCVVLGAHYDHLGFGGETSLAPGRHEVHPRRRRQCERGGGAPGGGARGRGWAAAAADSRLRGLQRRGARAPRFECVREAPAAGMRGGGHPADGEPRHGGPAARREALRAGRRHAEGGRARAERLAAASPSIQLRLAFGGDGYGPSNHTSFYAVGVPVVFLFTGAHGDYHRPSDTADKLDVRGLSEVARLAGRFVRDAAAAPERFRVVRAAPPPGYTPGAAPGERTRGYGAYLGSVPDFEERKEPGVLVSAVKPGSPAEQAGVRRGDVLLRIGATQLRALPDLAYVLRSHRAGDVVEVVWLRGAETLRAQVTLGERN